MPEILSGRNRIASARTDSCKRVFTIPRGNCLNPKMPVLLLLSNHRTVYRRTKQENGLISSWAKMCRLRNTIPMRPFLPNRKNVRTLICKGTLYQNNTLYCGLHRLKGVKYILSAKTSGLKHLLWTEIYINEYRLWLKDTPQYEHNLFYNKGLYKSPCCNRQGRSLRCT